MNDQALNYLGLARKGGNLETGDEPVRAAVRAGHARLVLLAADAGDHTQRRAENLSRSWAVPVLATPWTKLELGRAAGSRSCALAAFTEPRLALAFLRALDPPPDAKVMETLETQSQKAAARQAEARAHETKRKHGSAPQRKRTK